jgi:hypothetical protein
MLAQTGVLKEAYVTMAELPAAFFLNLALWLRIVRGRTRLAALAAGLAALCRNEMLVVALFAGGWLALDAVLGTAAPRRFRARTLITCLAPVSLSVAPFLLWVMCGAWLTGDLRWFNREVYAELRQFTPSLVVRYNALTGLSFQQPAPLLVGCLLGASLGFRLGQPRRVRWELTLPAGMLAVHFTLLSTLAITPEAWPVGPPGRSIAALTRNYNSTSGAAAVFVALGVAALGHGLTDRRRHFPEVFALTSLVAALAIVVARWDDPALLLTDFVCLVATCGGVWLLVRRHAGGDAALGRIWTLASIAAFAASLAIRPFFWYPTRFNEHAAAGAEAMIRLIRAERARQVIQDIVAFPEVFAELPAVDAAWSWSRDFPARLTSAEPGALLIVETKADGTLAPRYPAGLLERTHSRELTQVASYATPARAPFWQALDDLSARNPAMFWTAYRVSAR